MKILIIGCSVEDHFIIHGKEIIKPGGIFYAASALQNFIDNDEIFLLTAAADNNYNLFSSVYDKLNKKYFQKVDVIPKVNLTLCAHEERKEKYENINQSLELNLKDYSAFNGILINMITGFDITKEQLKELRKAYKGLIYFDVHTLSRGLNENMNREFRLIPDFPKWASSVDIIQVNQYELYTLSEKKDELEIVKDVLSCGVKFLIVTKEDLGCRLYSLKNGEVISIFKSAIKIKTGNKIGCGDVFGGIFFYSYIKNEDEAKALEKANIAAGYAASYTDLNEFKNLEQDVISRYN